MQAALRMLTSAEIMQHANRYPVDAEYAKAVANSSFFIGSVSMRALSNATHMDTDILGGSSRQVAVDTL